MKPSDLERIGKLLYGRNWVRPMAAALGLHRNTVMSWGKNVPEDHQDAVYLLIAQHAKKLLKEGKK